MTNETYIALGACARRRIEQEWECSAAERAVLQLVTELSFDLGQSWALVPCLGDFAAVLGVHKSTISRALRAALKQGYLLVLKRRDETLYAVCTETRGTKAPADRQSAEQVRARLITLNPTRLQGAADANGQQRIPGVLPSEEVAAPGRAFAAMVEDFSEATEDKAKEPKNDPRRTITPPATRAHSGDDDDESAEDFKARLERITREEMQRETGMAENAPRVFPQSNDAKNMEASMTKLCRGVKGEPLHALQRLREEFASAGKVQEAAFFKWGGRWRRDALRWPRQCLEVAGEHKALRQTSGAANEPGAWMYRALQDLTTVANV